MRKYLLLLLLLPILMFGCDKNENIDIPYETSAPEVLETFPVIGVGAPEYTIIEPMPTKVTIVNAASELHDTIEELTGKPLYFTTDWVDSEKGETIPEDAHEILIGDTNRRLSREAAEGLAENEFALAFDGTKLAVVAPDDYGVVIAVEHLIEIIKANGGSLSLPIGRTVTEFDYPRSVKLERAIWRELDFDYDRGCVASKMPEASEKFEGEILHFNMYDIGMSLLSRDSVAAFDAELAVIALQGLANREAPRLFVHGADGGDGNADQWTDGIDADYYWLYLYMGEGQYFEEATIKDIRWAEWKRDSEYDAISELFRSLEDYFCGLAVWDGELPATMLAACTAAGVENLIPVRYSEEEGSIYTMLAKTLGYEVKLDLRGKFEGEPGTKIWDTELDSTGSAKNDVYLWAKARYLDTGLTSPDYICLTKDGASYYEDDLGYQAPHNTVTQNFDFLISERAFFFDLSGTDRGTPQNDKNQPAGTDYDTFNKIMQAQYENAKGNENGGFYEVSGWPATSDGESDGTLTEWLTVELLSSYNGVIEMAGGGFSSAANISLLRHIPELDEYRQTAVKKDIKYSPDRTYIMFYMGDYDSVAWLTNVIPPVWESEARGDIPLSWGIAGMQDERAVHVYNYMYATATDNDYFVAANNGAGYLNPMFLLTENKDPDHAAKTIPDGLEAWIELCCQKYAKFELSATPFFIPNHLQDLSPNASTRLVLESYRAFSQGGLGWYNWAGTGLVNISGTPLLTTLDGSNNLADFNSVYDNLLGYLTNKDILKRERNMLLIREIIVDPAVIVRALDKIKEEHPELDFEVVDVYTFYEFAGKRMK